MDTFRSLSIAIAATLLLVATTSYSHSAIKVTDTKALYFESGVSECAAKFKDKQLISCIADATDRFASGLQEADIPSKAPEVSSKVSKAAASLRGAASNAAAISVLDRAKSVLRALAAKSSGEGLQVYKRVGAAFTQAIRVLRKT